MCCMCTIFICIMYACICDLRIYYKRQMRSYNCRIIYLMPPKWEEQHFSILTDLLIHFLIQLLFFLFFFWGKIQLLHSTMMIMTYESPSIHMQIVNDKVLLLLSFSQTKSIPDLLSSLNQTRKMIIELLIFATICYCTCGYEICRRHALLYDFLYRVQK